MHFTDKVSLYKIIECGVYGVAGSWAECFG